MKHFFLFLIFTLAVQIGLSQSTSFKELLSFLNLTNSQINTKLKNEGYKVSNTISVGEEVILSYSKKENETINIGGTIKTPNGKKIKSIAYLTASLSDILELLRQIDAEKLVSEQVNKTDGKVEFTWRATNYDYRVQLEIEYTKGGLHKIIIGKRPTDE